MDEFATSGEKYRDLPLLVIDIRGNGGGSTAYAIHWLNGMVGTQQGFFGKYSEIQKVSPLFIAYAKAQKGKSIYDYQVYKPFLGNWYVVEQDAFRIKNNNLILVLTDKNTGSAAEGFVHCLRGMDNTLFIGSNTGGCNFLGNTCDFHLPNSGLSITFGFTITFWETMQNREGIWILPDLWVNPADAMDAVLRMVEYYDLAKKT